MQTQKLVRLCEKKGFVPVVPSKSNMKKSWKYDKKLYRKRNEIEQLFHHLKNF